MRGAGRRLVIAGSSIAGVGWIAWITTVLVAGDLMAGSSRVAWVLGAVLVGPVIWLGVAPGIGELSSRPWRPYALSFAAVGNLVFAFVLALVGGSFLLLPGLLFAAAWWQRLRSDRDILDG